MGAYSAEEVSVCISAELLPVAGWDLHVCLAVLTNKLCQYQQSH